MAILLQVAGFSRSTFYYQCQVLQRNDKYKELKVHICAIYDKHKGRYGYRRITAVLRKSVQQINHKTVQRLMQELGLKSLIRVKKFRLASGEDDVSVPNILQRNFNASAPNEKWVTDITEFNVKGQKLYLSASMDVYNGEIVACHTSKRPVFELVIQTLKSALETLDRGSRPILHSDQGWQYKMLPYRKMISQYGLTQSMSRKGNCFDNAAIESFFGTLKAEFFHLTEFDSIEQLDAEVHDYIRYYNHERIKLKLNGLSPVDYRSQFATQSAIL